MFGEAGEDSLWGEPGDDVLSGGDGADLLRGGDDWLSLPQDSWEENTGLPNTIDGGSGNDLFGITQLVAADIDSTTR